MEMVYTKSKYLMNRYLGCITLGKISWDHIVANIGGIGLRLENIEKLS